MTGVAAADEISAPAFEKPATRILAAQPRQTDRITAEYVEGYFSDSGRMIAAPANWRMNDWLKAGLIIGATSGFYLADTDIRDAARRNQSSTGDKAASFGNVVGNPFYAVPSLGLFYLYGHLNHDSKARRASLLAVESIAISGVASMAIKLATQRPRPSSGEASTTWNGPGFKDSDSSFPSIHAQTAFSIASVLAEEYCNIPSVAPIAYGLATLTGLARIYDNKHWASDVFFGAAIGYITGKAVISYHTVQSTSTVKILPAVGTQGFGLTAEFRF